MYVYPCSRCPTETSNAAAKVWNYYLILMTCALAVSIAPQTEIISPLILGNQKNVDDLDLDTGRRSRKNSLIRKASSKRLSGRPPSFTSPVLRPRYAGSVQNDGGDDSGCPSSASSHHRHSGHHLEQLVDQVTQWIKDERSRHAERKAKRSSDKAGPDGEVHGADEEVNIFADQDFSGAGALDKLESIIKQNLSLERRSRGSRNRSPVVSRKASLIKLHRKQSTASSDTDHPDNEGFVPACDAALDNSKTMSYTGGASDDSDSDADDLQRTTSYRDRDEWTRFKIEIVRITHTLRLPRWRRVPPEMSGSITVQRLSGALTNAVYVVSPPSDLDFNQRSSISGSMPQKPPPKLLLRIYGPQVEHLIDREAELAILRRLARKSIGPRLLGTFANGRFEEYFYAKTLTPEDLRNPDTSRHIAKRMRELHDGIELLDQERDDGPFVWRNWDKWVARVEQVVSWLDCQIKRLPEGAKPTGSEAWKRRGYICGVPWNQFREMVVKYRKYLYAQYGSDRRVKEQLVFAHNDTQYGNILRLMPTGKSPYLLPENSHKRLVVIDFEYSNANVPGLEFANHFTEWSYDYHDERKPYAFHPTRYPTPEEQDRFIRAYVRHRPEVNVSTPRMAPSTPTLTTNDSSDSLARRPTSSIAEFMLDARTPPVGALSYATEEANRKAAEDQEVARLLHETRLWRLANTAQWVAWGIVQAKVPGMPDFSSTAESAPGAPSEEEAREELGEEADEYKEMIAQQQMETANGMEEEADDEFDYLGYSQHRALFFWADCLKIGLVKAEELPEELISKVKSVPY